MRNSTNVTPGCVYQPSSVMLPRVPIKYIYKLKRSGSGPLRSRDECLIGIRVLLA